MQLPNITSVKGFRVLTTKQIAKEYGTTGIRIQQNYSANKIRFVEGKHFVTLVGDELRDYKNHLGKNEVVDRRASHMYFWTEKGALLHAKSLNTEKAWEVYDYLVDHYFRTKEKPSTVPLALPKVPIKTPVPVTVPAHLVVDVPVNAEIQRLLRRIKRIASAIDLLADSCSVYSFEEAYNGKVEGIYQMFLELARPVTDLKHRKVTPRLIEQPK